MKYFFFISGLIVFSMFNIIFTTTPIYSEKNEQDFSLGKIEWSEKCHPLIFNTGLVRVTDSDMNRNPNTLDKFEIKVWSNFDAREDYRGKIVSLIVTETGNSTGIFESTVFWGNPQDDSLGNRIPIWDNSTVTALYVDDTLPQSNSKANVTSSLIVKDVEPTYKKLRNGTSVPYYIYDLCTMQFLDTARYQFTQKIEFIFPPPSEQLTEGISLDQVKCKENLTLIKKASNENLVCVKPETKVVLIERGWGSKLETISDSKTPIPSLDKKYTVQVNGNIFEIRYSIIGSQLQEIIADPNAKSIIVNLENSEKGQMTIEIPRKLIDARIEPDGKSGEDTDFFVLVNGSEVNFEESRSTVTRILTIPIENDSSQIEIIGTVGYPYSQVIQ